MSEPVTAQGDRLLAFEIAVALYALPIADVAEVSEALPVAAVPMLSPAVGGVVNHHGDALPIVHASALFEGARASDAATHLLVLARDPDDPNRYGLPVDAIRGLIDGPVVASHEEGPVAERRPMDGRLLNVLDPRRLLERAVAVIEGSMTGAGGE